MTNEEYEKFTKKAVKFALYHYGKRQLSLTTAEDDARDIVSDIFMRKEERAWKTAAYDEREAMILNRIRSRIRNAAKKLWTKKEVVFTTGLSVDEAPHGDFSDDGDEENIESALLSDNGKCAQEIRSFDELGPLPPFSYLVRYEVSRLRGLDSKVARSVMKYRTITEAIKKTKLGSKLFYAILKNLKPRFTQCLQARNEFNHPLM